MKPAQKPITKKKKPFLFTERHEEILREVYYYRHMRLLDIVNLLYKETGRSYAGEVLAALSGSDPEYPLPLTGYQRRAPGICLYSWFSRKIILSSKRIPRQLAIQNI